MYNTHQKDNLSLMANVNVFQKFISNYIRLERNSRDKQGISQAKLKYMLMHFTFLSLKGNACTNTPPPPPPPTPTHTHTRTHTLNTHP